MGTRTLEAIVMLACLCTCALGQEDRRVSVADVTGTYQRCRMVCDTITLDPDGRFTFVVDGDLFNNLRAEGVWRIDREAHLILNGDWQPQISESHTEIGSDEIRFRVLDQNRDVLEGANGYIYCPEVSGLWMVADGDVHPNTTDEGFSFRFDSDGYVYVSDCRPVRFRVGLYTMHSVEYVPVNEESNDFAFVLDTRTNFYVTDEVYGWEPGCLYLVAPEVGSGGCDADALRQR